MCSNEASHSFLSPPCTTGQVCLVGGLTRIDTVQLLFQNGLRRMRVASLCAKLSRIEEY